MVNFTSMLWAEVFFNILLSRNTNYRYEDIYCIIKLLVKCWWNQNIAELYFCSPQKGLQNYQPNIFLRMNNGNLEKIVHTTNKKTLFAITFGMQVLDRYVTWCNLKSVNLDLSKRIDQDSSIRSKSLHFNTYLSN